MIEYDFSNKKVLMITKIKNRDIIEVSLQLQTSSINSSWRRFEMIVLYDVWRDRTEQSTLKATVEYFRHRDKRILSRVVGI